MANQITKENVDQKIEYEKIRDSFLKVRDESRNKIEGHNSEVKSHQETIDSHRQQIRELEREIKESRPSLPGCHKIPTPDHPDGMICRDCDIYSMDWHSTVTRGLEDRDIYECRLCGYVDGFNRLNLQRFNHWQ